MLSNVPGTSLGLIFLLAAVDESLKEKKNNNNNKKKRHDGENVTAYLTEKEQYQTIINGLYV